MEKISDPCIIEVAQSIRHSIFGTRVVMGYGAESPFQNKTSWEIVAVPGSVVDDISWSKSFFYPVFAAVIEIGDAAGFLIPMPVGEPWFTFMPDVQEFSLLPFFSLGYGGDQLFGPSGAWAMATLDDSVTVLGGGPLFMDTYFRLAGGRERVQQQFIEYDLSDEWPAFHSYEHGEQAKIDAFYRLLGWPRPDYPYDTK